MALQVLMAEEMTPKRELDLRLIIRLLSFAKPHWKLVVLTLAAMTVFACSEPCYVLIVQPLADKTIAEKDVQSLWWIGWLLLALVPVVSGSCAAQEYLQRRVVTRVVVDIRNAICRALLPQSLSYFDKRGTGDFISRITNDVGVTQRALMFVVGDIYLQPVRMIAAAVLAVRASWQLALISVVLLPMLVVPLRILGKRIRHASKQSLETLAELTAAMQQMFTGIRIVKAFRMEDAEEQEFMRHNQRFFRRMMRAARARGLSDGVVTLFRGLAIALIVMLGGWLVVRGYWHISIGQLGAFVVAVALMYQPIKRLTKCYNDLQEVLAGCERIFQILDQRPEIQDHPQAVEIPGVRKGIAFRNVSFTYDREQVLHNISLEVNAGETVAIVGRSGAGKSTLVNLIPRLYDATEGSVEIDGIDVRRIKHDSLLSHVAMVTQQTFLFDRTIAENIRYGKRDATQAEIEAAAKAANVHDFIMTLPQRYDTEVGEFGVRLSGGQRQRIAIARAILKNPDILILDEAMVGLDAESETLVREALIELMKGRTTFLIAHDFSTVLHANRIVVLKDGRLLGCGTHEELLQNCEEYRLLYTLQSPAGVVGRC